MTIIAKDLIERLQRVDPYAKVYVGKMPLLDGPAPVNGTGTSSGIVDLDPDFETVENASDAIDDRIEDAKESIMSKVNPALEKLIALRIEMRDSEQGADDIDAVINLLSEI